MSSTIKGSSKRITRQSLTDINRKLLNSVVIVFFSVGQFGMPLDGDVLELNQMDKLVNEMIQDLEMDLFQVEGIVENDPPVDCW